MITREFILAGRAIFTISNGKGDWYTYRVHDLFADILCGPDNGKNYRQVAVIHPDSGQAVWTPGSVFNVRQVQFRVLAWAVRVIWTQSSLPQGYDIRHAGRCGRCARLLTTPESLESGFGPECRSKIGLS